ncbi:MAG: 4-hydroxy-tetrahydrodipicolinate synthase [Flavobacteriales bacterium]|nr:4-hydroxy-tetrahydrodipicolinate synthase [Flavobacteriales bacterium]
MNMFKGVGVALVTPFQSNGQVDFTALQRLVEHQINNGTDYLVVQGTTGESATLSSDEKKAVLEFIIEINAKRLPIVLGIGGNNTRAVVEGIESAELKDVDGILSVSPYYNKPSQEGIYLHYKTISAATSKPIILYNVPGRTMSNVLAQTTLRIARDCKNIVAVKEASGNLEQVMEIINNKPEGFVVLSGDDALTLPHMAIGGDGVISVVANAFPKRFSTLVHAAMENNMDLAREKHYELFEVIQQLFADGNPGGVKHVLKLLNICDDNLRLPLVPVSKDVADKLYALTAKIGEKVV